MENLCAISSSQKLVLGCIGSRRDIIPIASKPLFAQFRIPGRSRSGSEPTKATSISALSRPHSHNPTFSIRESNGTECFARISFLGGKQTSSVAVDPQLSPTPPPSHVGSPLFWAGVGVGLSVLFSSVATSLMNYAMLQAFKSSMNGQMDTQNSQFTNAAAFPPATSPSEPASECVLVDVPTNKVEAPLATNIENDLNVEEEPMKGQMDSQNNQLNNAAFPPATSPSAPASGRVLVDVPPNKVEASPATNAENDLEVEEEPKKFEQPSVVDMFFEALEKMYEDDPKLQEMAYPFLLQELKNPETFKWMLRNPRYRQIVQAIIQNPQDDILNEFPEIKQIMNCPEIKQIIDDLEIKQIIDDPEIKQMLDKYGLTPEQALSIIMDNLEFFMAFLKPRPRVEQALSDCLKNPMSIVKYHDDKEVLDVFNKIFEILDGVSGRRSTSTDIDY